jgi:aryl-alcohol dehydrogenase-like predicted oxidoreductase
MPALRGFRGQEIDISARSILGSSFTGSAQASGVPALNLRVLPGTKLAVSAFSFGTAALHHLRSSKDREALLFAAADHGFTHFDTAPLYGFGLAESSLAPLLASRPHITVTTKAGLYAPGSSEQTETGMLARKIAGKVVPSLSRAQADWSVERAGRSLISSLRRLGRERVDILLLHEPDRALIQTDEWLRWLESCRDQIGYFGISGAANRIAPFLAAGDPLGAIVQTADSAAGREADAVLITGRQLQLTYGYLATRGASPAEETLTWALRRNSAGSVLVSTRHQDRLDLFSRIGG